MYEVIKKLINMKKPKVIVLILSYNGKTLLKEAINSYLANDYSNFEVTIIDNGSTDGTMNWVQANYPNVTVLRIDENMGYSGGFNFGLRYAFIQKNADYVLITNNDVRSDRKVIHNLVETAEKDNSIGFVTGKVYFYDHPEILQSVGFYEDQLKWIGGHLGNQEKDLGQYDQIEERAFSDDIFMLVKRELYEDTEGYDTNFQFQAEQFDWQIRAKKMGYKLYFTPYAKIWHKVSFTIGRSSPFKQYHDTRNSLIVRLKHRDKNFLKPYFSWYLKNKVAIPFVKNLAKGKIQMSFYTLKGFLSALIWGFQNKKIPFK